MVFLTALPVLAEWKRYENQRMDKPDTPPAHTLAYFRANPCLRQDLRERPSDCGDAKLNRADLVAIGKIGRFTIFDLSYNFDGDPDSTPAIKSILVQSGADEFHELYVVERYWTQGWFPNTEIVEVGSQQILRSVYRDGGLYSGNTEEYFAFSDEKGPVLLDFGPVYEAAARVGGGWNLAAEFDFPSQTWKSGINPGGARVTCCEGSVVVSFRIDPDDRVIVTKIDRDPPSPASWRRYAETTSGFFDTDTHPEAHPLPYFRTDPCSRSDDHISTACEGGNADSPVAVRAEVSEVGKISGLTVLDVTLYFDDGVHPSDSPGFRSVLVESGKDEFQEIFAIEDGKKMQRGLGSSAIVETGDGKILRALSRSEGGGNPPDAYYFALYKDGAVLLNFFRLREAALKAVPAGEWYVRGETGKFDFPSLKWTVGVTTSGDQNAVCCDGEVVVNFRLEQGAVTATPVGAKYTRGSAQ
jgi:hypothetical protein